MVTLTETPTPLNADSVVNDQIQKVIDRLESGEQLVAFSLRELDSYCVMGLFADESKMGRWINLAASLDMNINSAKHYEYAIEGEDLVSFTLSESMCDHFDLLDGCGAFDFDDLPAELQKQLVPILDLAIAETDILGDIGYNKTSLSAINDVLVKMGYTVEYTNKVLADIIKSRAIFKTQDG